MLPFYIASFVLIVCAGTAMVIKICPQPEPIFMWCLLCGVNLALALNLILRRVK